ncbi:hypothetical protein AVEN_157422-1 [Araneus ventricosus]|uniref:Uncharacterized protein n=1 Tax=Araneus ventricosus TaxID=182803 RepID=A0A4Y2GP93_ARAVE|nr:hypothetical protein AVEN_157422-1 [Araneus ventricosus]
MLDPWGRLNIIKELYQPFLAHSFRDFVNEARVDWGQRRALIGPWGAEGGRRGSNEIMTGFGLRLQFLNPIAQLSPPFKGINLLLEGKNIRRLPSKASALELLKMFSTIVK